MQQIDTSVIATTAKATAALSTMIMLASMPCGPFSSVLGSSLADAKGLEVEFDVKVVALVNSRLALEPEVRAGKSCEPNSSENGCICSGRLIEKVTGGVDIPRQSVGSLRVLVASCRFKSTII